MIAYFSPLNKPFEFAIKLIIECAGRDGYNNILKNKKNKKKIEIMSSSVTNRIVQCSIATASGGETNYPAKLQPPSFSTVTFRSDRSNDHASSGE